jgi:hypothetical protein
MVDNLAEHWVASTAARTAVNLVESKVEQTELPTVGWTAALTAAVKASH